MLIKTSSTLFLLLLLKSSHANDGTYYTSGNHLIPMYETSISVKKEILSLKRVDKDFVNVTVYYEFYNPGEAKTVEVGFEANLPYGDVEIDLSKLKHPFIQNFTVNMNGKILPYNISLVNDSIYYKDGKFIEKPAKEVEGLFQDQWPEHIYLIYHFKANFIKGLNIISHTYTYKMSSTVGMASDINYILTAANRWANKQIDDFTLILDMGNFSDFYIPNSFFKRAEDWKILGIGKSKMKQVYEDSCMNFKIQNGYAFFQKLNFKPIGELDISFSSLFISFSETFQYYSTNSDFVTTLSYPIEISLYITKAKDETSLKILRNLPYARRGYIFKSPEIQKYYEGMEWYIPDPNYEADLSKLTLEEQEWLKKLSLD